MCTVDCTVSQRLKEAALGLFENFEIENIFRTYDIHFSGYNVNITGNGSINVASLGIASCKLAEDEVALRAPHPPLPPFQ